MLPENAKQLSDLLSDLEFKFDLITLTETLNPEYKSQTFNPQALEGYFQYHVTTGSTAIGGCGMYINNLNLYLETI